MVEEPGERRALRLAARCPGIPFTKSEEVETGRDKDVAEMDFRLPAIAREPESAAADAAGELCPRCQRGGDREVVVGWERGGASNRIASSAMPRSGGDAQAVREPGEGRDGCAYPRVVPSVGVRHGARHRDVATLLLSWPVSPSVA